MTTDKKNTELRGKVQDAIDNSWVDLYAPMALRPYLRLSRFDRPVGAWLLFLPCVFGIFAAGWMVEASIAHMLHLLMVCAIGAWLMRGAGCTWNDIVDRKIDAQVDRTKSRPIPSGAVSVQAALLWMGAQALISLLVLLSLSPATVLTAIASLAIVAFYPFAKRVTYWPQIVLGLAFNWGVFVAWVELTGKIDLAAFALYLAMIFWTLFYDTIYAFQDIEDDALIGVKSTARALKGAPRKWLGRFLLAIGVLLALSLLLLPKGDDFFPAILLTMGAIAFLVLLERMRSAFDPKDRKNCLMQFRGNVRIGQVMAICWGIGYLSAIFL